MVHHLIQRVRQFLNDVFGTPWIGRCSTHSSDMNPIENLWDELDLQPYIQKKN
ncbi:hypothetical protein WN51_07399 [Melipona quadrifasciata]|uniref:Uncharacterized protein n=1 Tax=Melipona quadrifasciata TaxID=166423 RepID=A0A0N0BCA6_9HYME|nr:hypothetical protein WN51_07399 [Melipona quadrifasciata]